MRPMNFPQEIRCLVFGPQTPVRYCIDIKQARVRAVTG